MNSNFHGDAVTQRKYYCNPVMEVDQGGLLKRPTLLIQGKILHKINPSDQKWCQTTRDRYDHAYTYKKGQKKKTIFTPTIPEVLGDGTVVAKPIAPAKAKKKKK